MGTVRRSEPPTSKRFRLQSIQFVVFLPVLFCEMDGVYLAVVFCVPFGWLQHKGSMQGTVRCSETAASKQEVQVAFNSIACISSYSILRDGWCVFGSCILCSVWMVAAQRFGARHSET